MSMDSFARSERHPDDSFLLVMEDTEQQRLAGCAGVSVLTGARQAFYAYRLIPTTHYSHSLEKQVSSQLLHLTNDYTGCSEVGSLFLLPDYRGNGHWLARSRYLLMGLFRQRFAESVIAELRGWSDDEGRSPFWEAIGKHFFQMEFEQADKLCGLGSNQFITELMPKYPIYTTLLPDDAQAVIGQPADAGRPAMELLQREGFRYDNVVDIFDAGPLMQANIDELASVKAIEQRPLTDVSATPQSVIAANTHWPDFRVVLSDAQLDEHGIQLPAAERQALQLNEHDSVAFIAL
ncbi:arginine N-succinyltransferase [Bacterioplanes sanyensis]|uniref:Arginine N-succinyltransferase n=1 Tax=Bacterioplanes sanyensis TaxID=1249553 RepID=A0A222FFD6_9GAMM|nr:arginine N-succinyltransferase [Bacterioplanes sanyensis]ASP37286.1 arginine N-succinyltransferase [Bacterioplanes sanyensis]